MISADQCVQAMNDVHRLHQTSVDRCVQDTEIDGKKFVTSVVGCVQDTFETIRPRLTPKDLFV